MDPRTTRKADQPDRSRIHATLRRRMAELARERTRAHAGLVLA